MQVQDESEIAELCAIMLSLLEKAIVSDLMESDYSRLESVSVAEILRGLIGWHIGPVVHMHDSV